MSTARALKLCPQLVLLPPDFERYRAASRQILDIYRDYTALVEPLSLDEAYLDVTGIERCRGSATLMAAEIRARIHAEVGITASAGIAPNKFIAKVASDWNKPDGQFVVRPEQVDAFVAALPVGKLFGVGRVTAARMRRLGIETCADLRSWSLAELTHRFGSFGARLHRLCRGIDERPVAPDRPRKSLSVETTYVSDLPDAAACREALDPLIDDLVARLGRLREGRRSSSSSSRSGSTISRTPRQSVCRPPRIRRYGSACLPRRWLARLAGCDCSVSVCVLPSRSNRAAASGFAVSRSTLRTRTSSMSSAGKPYRSGPPRRAGERPGPAFNRRRSPEARAATRSP